MRGRDAMTGRAGHLDVELVRGALTAAQALDYHGVRYQRRGDQLRTRLCPVCGPRSRDSVTISDATGAWVDHAHGCRGDLMALIAGYAGIDVAREYPRVIALAAQIAGVAAAEPDPDPDRDRRIAERRRIDDERCRREQAEIAALRAQLPRRWDALDRRSLVGERYLAGRRIDPAELRHRGDVVRYSDAGEPAVGLRDLATGEVVGVQYRAVDGAERKLRCERGSQVAGSALHGRVADLDPDGTDVAILVEGLADTLAACLAWPGCAVYGAPGCGQLAAVAAAIAPRIVAARGWLYVVPHVDRGAGERAAADAIIAAEDAGLVLDRSLHLVDVRPHKDLADAWRAGWRWPS